MLVFREGLESVLVIAAITASMVGASQRYRAPVIYGVAIGIAATLVTWTAAVRLVDRLAENISALHMQAITGLVAIIVLLIVMNWYFHKLYWAGWISLHNKRKRQLLNRGADDDVRGGVTFGLIFLGFTSFYREGVEVVIFLQTYRLELGSQIVLQSVLLGSFLTAVVAALTFFAHRRLPYKKMLIATGGMLGVVLLVMVGEQAQEMQLARWLTVTPIPTLERIIPGWMELWFAVFPTVETLMAQAIAAVLVVGSYVVVQVQLKQQGQSSSLSNQVIQS